MKNGSKRTLFFICCLVLLPCMQSAFGQTAPGHGMLVGNIRDRHSDAPVGWAQVLVEEANRSMVSDDAGRFEFRNLTAGAYTLKIFRIGYEPFEGRVHVAAGDTVTIHVTLSDSPVEAGDIVVEGERTFGNGSIGQAVLTVEGSSLRRKLGITIAETLAGEPGVAMRSMGPAPARPVLRGLSGDRLLVLEDGGRTGDLSATSADHAVVIEPLTARRIEIVRGPSALAYGPNTLGGVVNVIHQLVPSSRLDDPVVDVSFQGESVNRAVSTGLTALAPVGPLVVNVEGSLRETQDLNTPVGLLRNSSISTYNASVGASRIGLHGYAGIAATYYQSEYGIPGGFVGAHPEGVTVRLDRKQLIAKGEYVGHSPLIQRFEGNARFSRYFHQEFESSGALGVEFGTLTYSTTLLAHTRPQGVLRSGAIGLSGEYRHFVSGGLYFTPTTQEASAAAFVYQQASLGRLNLEAGLRYDVRTVMPEEEEESHVIGRIRRRSFKGLSASIGGTWFQSSRLALGVAMMYSLRLPVIEELFSEGPHLAAYSFEIGNPDLEEERGYGVELSLAYTGSQGKGSVTVFRNLIDGYIYPRNTGELNYRTLLPIYQFSGMDAVMSGFELTAEWRLNHHISAGGNVSYVRGTLRDLGLPLPWMPPLTGKMSVRYHRNPFGLEVGMRTAAGQERTGEFEDPTDPYRVFDLGAQYHFTTGRFLHTIDFGVENAFDATYRDHLSRVKAVMPEPGRNVKLLYKVYF